MEHVDLRRYYVYAHSIKGNVFYVGSGVSNRPYTERERNKTWHSIVAATGYFDVQILSRHRTRNAALKRELKEITERQPIANVNHPPGRPAGFCAKQTIHRVQVPLSTNDRCNIDKLIKLRKYGLTKADVIRTAVIYLMEKAEEL